MSDSILGKGIERKEWQMKAIPITRELKFNATEIHRKLSKKYESLKKINKKKKEKKIKEQFGINF